LRILICHGYLLRGTGSNMFVQSLARALCGQGHNVLISCQESDPCLDFVSAFIKEEPDGSARLAWDRETAYPGPCTVVQPYIGGLLPVYVSDSYPGFEVKEFAGLDGRELERYVEHNRRSLGRLVEQFAPGAIQVNHAVMLPYIVRPVARDAGVPYYVTIHGSAIEFAVKRDSRYLDYGARGIEGAARVFVPSRHTSAQVTEVFASLVEGLEAKLVFVPPGVDTRLFDLAQCDLATSVDLLLDKVERRTDGVTVGDDGRNAREGRPVPKEGADLEDRIAAINRLHPDWLPEGDLAERLRPFSRTGAPFVMFLGKLLETKGLQCALPALPLVMNDHPDARLVAVGFGELRGILELMLGALDDGDIELLTRLCRYGNERYTLADEPFTPVISFLEDIRECGGMDAYLRLCGRLDLRSSVIFTGYLAPEEHRHLLSHARAVLVLSLAQEAFGLVATEAMAAGAVPIAMCHSGLETALAPMREIWGRDAYRLLLGTRERLVGRVAEACDFILGMQEAALKARGKQMRDAVKECFSWDAVSRQMVEIME
jgi:glycosyltransferase involved in cell wall biosynthesis